MNNIRFIDPVFGRKVRDEAWLYHFKNSCKAGLKQIYKRPLLGLWKITSNYGRNFWLWALWSIIFAFLFACIYYFGFYINNPDYFKVTYVSKNHPYFSFLYYSAVTFTTLGFGDIVPKSGWIQFWVMFEVVLGYIMLGGLISIFANILARRND